MDSEGTVYDSQQEGMPGIEDGSQCKNKLAGPASGTISS